MVGIYAKNDKRIKYSVLYTFVNLCIYFLLLLVLHASLIALSKLIGAHSTDVSVGARLLSGETFLQAKNSTGGRWDSNPGPCR